MLYLKAHLFKSTQSAVSLAEKSLTPKNIVFAKRLLETKNNQEDLKLNKQVIYNNVEMKHSEKYAQLFSRVNILFPELPPRDYESNEDAETQFSRIDELSESFEYSDAPVIERFKNIKTAPGTQITLSDRTRMPANRITIGGKDIAIRCQYPKDDYLPQHFQMMLENKIAVTVVLSSSEDIDNRMLPKYFCKSKDYNGISVNCKVRNDSKNGKKIETKLGGLILNHYRMTIDDGHDKLTSSVIHVTNWPDFESIKTNDLKDLTHFVKSKIQEKCKDNSDLCEQPLFHCTAGAGRAGVLIGAMVLTDNTNKSGVENIVLEMRKTGASGMVQNVKQYKALVALDKELNGTTKRA